MILQKCQRLRKAWAEPAEARGAGDLGFISQHHSLQHVPPLPEAQDSSSVMDCWSLQDYAPWCLVQKQIPHRWSFTQQLGVGVEARHLKKEEKKKFLCASVSPSLKCRDYVRFALSQLWGMEIFLGGTEWALKTVVRGFLLCDQLQGILSFSVPCLSHSSPIPESLLSHAHNQPGYLGTFFCCC